MWQDKKFIVIVALLVILVAVGGTLGGLALARQNNDGPNQVRAARIELLEKAANFFQADNKTLAERQEMRAEVLDNFLQKLVEEGKITQEEADQFKAWWAARSDIPGLISQLAPDFTHYFGMMHMGGGGVSFQFG